MSNYWFVGCHDLEAGFQKKGDQSAELSEMAAPVAIERTNARQRSCRSISPGAPLMKKGSQKLSLHVTRSRRQEVFHHPDSGGFPVETK